MKRHAGNPGQHTPRGPDLAPTHGKITGSASWMARHRQQRGPRQWHIFLKMRSKNRKKVVQQQRSIAPSVIWFFKLKADRDKAESYGTKGTASRPSVSGKPLIRLKLCTAWEAAPRARLSMTEMTMTRPRAASTLRPRSQ